MNMPGFTAEFSAYRRQAGPLKIADAKGIFLALDNFMQRRRHAQAFCFKDVKGMLPVQSWLE